MKRLSAYALTAAATLAAAGSLSIPAYAAVNTYNIPGANGKVVMIGGNNMADFNQILNQINGGSYWQDCQPFIPGMPDFDFPNGNVPDNSLPTPDYPTPDYPIPDEPSDSEEESSQDEMVSQVVQLVNEERSKAGLAPLTVNNRAADAAQMRAAEIVSVFSHTRPNGSSYSTALSEAGVNYRASGENIAYGQRTAEQVMSDWMNSSGHRDNILNSNYTSIGVGHYQNAAGVDYWTQLFTN